jgi:hypothetical protein
LNLFFLSFLFTLTLSLERAFVLEGEPLKKRFDLSGLLLLTDKIKKDFELEGYDLLLIDDKTYWVYKAKVLDSSIRVEKWKKVGKPPSGRHDFEDIDSDGEFIYVLNEPDGAVARLEPNGKIQWATWKMPDGIPKFTDWFGAEALAVANGQLWIFREMPPLDAFVFDRKSFSTSVVVKRRTRSFSKSQTAARFRNQTWFLLDRDARCIWETSNYEEEGTCHSFSDWVDKDEHYRFQVRDGQNRLRPEWSTAEALDVDAHYFWVGLDNNGLGLYRDRGMKSPVILKFKRRP